MKRARAASVFRWSFDFRICCATASNRSTARFKAAITEFGYREPVSRRFSDQGQSVARSDRRDRRCRAAISFRTRSRQQTGAGRRARDAQGSGEPHHLQRLQGSRFHPHRACSAANSASRSSSWSRNSRSSSKPFALRRKSASNRTSAFACVCYSKGSGKWSPSGGENAKFGLDTTSLVAASRDAKGGGTRALPQARSFPCRLAGAGYFHDQTRGARSGALLREAVQARARARLSRCRRRTRRRLRRFAQRFRQLGELLAPGICQRRRLEHHGRLRFRRRCRIRRS